MHMPDRISSLQNLYSRLKNNLKVITENKYHIVVLQAAFSICIVRTSSLFFFQFLSMHKHVPF